MWRTSLISLACFAGFQVLYIAFGWEFCTTLRTTALTVFYHFALRLVFGEWLLPRFFAERIDADCGWFRVRGWETALYRRMGVQKWKGKMPTYNPEEFSLEERSLGELVRATCRAEIVHEFNVAASFVPLLFAIPFGAFPVFLITSIAAAAFDLVFVVMQRYNRPRLLRLTRMREGRKA